MAIGSAAVTEMRFTRTRIALHAVCALCVCVYLSAVIGRSVRAGSAPDLRADLAGPGQRAPRSVPDYQQPEESAETESVYRPSPRLEPAAAAAAAVSRKQNQLDNVLISVKTTGKFHRSRLDPILDTWFNEAKLQTWFFSDVDDKELQERTGGHVVNTNCSSSHHRSALCCKMAAEYDFFLQSNKKWFCHFDDDNYVNTARLGELLAGYSPQEDWYFGKNSIRTPLQIMDRDHRGDRISFWFATGGAGFCISRSLALKMSQFASDGKFVQVGEKIRLPDDVTMGYIVEHLVGVPLTVIDKFHSHLEQMTFIRPEVLDQQISFSYSQFANEMNVINVNTFDEEVDPTRFYSLHCLLHPETEFCPR